MHLKFSQWGMQGLGIFARKGLLAFSFLAIGRVLGPEALGQYTYIYTWVYVCFLISSMGLAPVSIREIARNNNAAAAILRASLTARLSFSALAVMLLSGFGWFLHLGFATSLALLSLTSFPGVVMDQLGAFVMGFARNSTFALINTIQYGTLLAGTLMGAYMFGNLYTVILFQVIASYLAGVLVLCCLYRSIQGMRYTSFELPLIKKLIQLSLPLAVTNVLGVLYFRIGTLQLFRYAGSQSTGLYTSSLQVLEALQIIPMAIMGATFPLICKMVGNENNLNMYFQRTINILLFLSLFFAATGSVLSETIVAWIFGLSFQAGAGLLNILIWAAVPTFLHFALAYFLIAVDLQRFVTLNALIGVVISFSLNWILIPRLGALGAVYASVFTECSICILHFIVLVKKTSIRPQAILFAFPAGGALFVAVTGMILKTRINGSVFQVMGFGVFSLALFAAFYGMARRFRGAGMEEVFTL